MKYSVNNSLREKHGFLVILILLVFFSISAAFIVSKQNNPIVGTWIGIHSTSTMTREVYTADGTYKFYYEGKLMATETYKLSKTPIHCGIDESERLKLYPEESILIMMDSKTNKKKCYLVYKLTENRFITSAFPAAPESMVQKITNLINKYAGKFGIDNIYELQHLLAQVAAETSFEHLTEYGHTKQWYNDHYGGLYGNNEKGDGYRYRGRGILQLTFKGAYKNFTRYYDSHFDSNLDFVKNPSLLASNLKIAVISGLWYFKYRVMSDVDIDSQTTSKEITKQINPGAGHEDVENRRNNFNKVKKYIKSCK